MRNTIMDKYLTIRNFWFKKHFLRYNNFLFLSHILPRVELSNCLIPHILDFDEMGGLPKLIFQKQLRALDVEIDDPGVLVDLDTWKDYEQALKKN